MIPVNSLGGHFLNPTINQNQPIITARLPVRQVITYTAEVATGGPARARLITFGLATAKLRDPLSIPRMFACDLNINGIYDTAMVDRIE